MKKTAILKKLPKACAKAVKLIRKEEEFPGEYDEEVRNLERDIAECIRFIERDELSRASDILRKVRNECYEDLDIDDIFDAVARSTVE